MFLRPLPTHIPNTLGYLGAPQCLCVSPHRHHFTPSPLHLLSYSAPSPSQEGITQIVEAREWRWQRALDKESSLCPVLHSQLCLQLATGPEASLCPSLDLSFFQDLPLRLWVCDLVLRIPMIRRPLQASRPLCSICSWNLGEADVPTRPLGAYPGPGDVTGKLKEMTMDDMHLPQRPIPATSPSELLLKAF